MSAYRRETPRLARRLYRRLEEDWLLLADRNFYNWADWCAAADTGAALLWRVKAGLILPVLEMLPDGSFRSVLISPPVAGKARQRLIEAAAPARSWTKAGPAMCGRSSMRCPAARVTGRAS